MYFGLVVIGNVLKRASHNILKVLFYTMHFHTFVGQRVDLFTLANLMGDDNLKGFYPLSQLSRAVTGIRKKFQT